MKKTKNIFCVHCLRIFLLAFCFCCFFASFAHAEDPVGAIALPVNTTPAVTASTEDKPVFLAPYMRYAYNLDAKDAKSALAQKNNFLPYDVLELKKEPGTYWFLISFDKIEDKDTPTAYLDLGNFLPKNSHILVYSKRTNRWQVLEDVYTSERKSNEESFVVDSENALSMFHSGLYDLTSLRDGGELLIYSPGVPSLWFAPKLVSPAMAPLSLEKRFTPFIMLLIFALMVFSFWRGAKEEGDARIWASLLCLAVIVQFAWGVPQNPQGKLTYLDMVGAIASCLAIFFLPHIGRHLLVTEKKSPHFDSLLQFLAIPAIFPLIVLFVPLPEYLYLIRFAPLWGLYALILFVITIPLVLSGRKGAKLYAFFCLTIGVGTLLALALRHNPEWYFLNYLGVAIAMIAIFLAPRQTEKNIFDEQLNHEDIVTAFAENNMIMRDALYRVELKLREPFDRIMREACFMDFDLKTEDLSDSLTTLKEKEVGDIIEKKSFNAIDDIECRTSRLQERSSSLVLACRDLSGMLGQITQLAQKEMQFQQVHELFSVKTLITNACDAIRSEAQDRQVGLGWYIAPNIGLYYRGDKNRLENVLTLLLRDAIRATEKGMISIRVRRANSPNPGHIVFTLSDSGKGRPPVERSILTLLKAWELSSLYNGEVELKSSEHGLNFSFSLQCLAMDEKGEKPLSYASLDDIVLGHNEASYQKKKAGLSGGNIVFTKDSRQPDKESDTIALADNNTGKDEQNIGHDREALQAVMGEKREQFVSYVKNKKNISILLISPLAIWRQNLAYYLNSYETWEALDVESALAFYEKKPASLVIVHGALSENGCYQVIAGIRLLEDSLGIGHSPCLGLSHVGKDEEFLRLAGCKHILPDTIGREDLRTAVAEILGDKGILPIVDVDLSHAVLRKAENNLEHPMDMMEKNLHRERVHAGTVVDGALVSEDLQDELPVKTAEQDKELFASEKKNDMLVSAYVIQKIAEKEENKGQSREQKEYIAGNAEQLVLPDKQEQTSNPIMSNPNSCEPKQGFFAKLFGKKALDTEQKTGQGIGQRIEEEIDDYGVGEPQPISRPVNMSDMELHPENEEEFVQETGQTGNQDENESVSAESIVETMVETFIGAEVSFIENNTEELAEDKTEEKAEDKDKAEEKSGKIQSTLRFFPIDNEQNQEDEDLPSFAVQIAKNEESIQNISEELSEEDKKTQLVENMVDIDVFSLAEHRGQQNKSMETTAPILSYWQEQEVINQPETAQVEAEEHDPAFSDIILAEQDIIELSSEMLVRTKENIENDFLLLGNERENSHHANLETNHETNLDIMIDIDENRQVGHGQDEHEETELLSFFPTKDKK